MGKINSSFNQKSDPIFNALIEGDVHALENSLSSLLLGYVSIIDYAVPGPHENYYHGFLNGVLSQVVKDKALKYDSNIELGSGRADIAFVIQTNDVTKPPIGVIIEIKATKVVEELYEKSNEALKQIEGKGYYKVLFIKNPRVRTIKAFGIAFCDKDCVVESKDYTR